MYENIQTLNRLKSNCPFSGRLNTFIKEYIDDLINCNLIKGIEYTDKDNYDTLEKITNHFKETGNIIVSTIGTDNNIFGNRETNLLFRVWHDFIHIKYQYDFSLNGESLTAFKQVSELQTSWNFEKMLLMTEIIGQWLYFNKYNDFIVDQRKFTIDYLICGEITKKY
jgi:hypothetical protein